MFSHPYMRTIMPVLALAAIAALGAYIYLTVKEARYIYSGPVTISVTGEGEAVAVPDLATFSFSVYAEGADATAAQNQSAEAINGILAYLKENGVEDRDIKTQYYNLNPRYEWTESICNTRGVCPPGERVLRGYEVSQNVTVKVRATDKAGELISGVGALGATDVSGLQFTIDDEDTLKAEAREKAIADAKAKADVLAENLGVRIVRMTSFWEDEGGYYPMNAYGAESKAVSMDAGMPVAPSMPTGENTITRRVNISYEVR